VIILKSLVVDKNGELSIKELPIPEINEYQALVKLVSCGICNGTDMKLIHRNFKGFDTYPAILGHEGVGKVIKLGAKVRGFKVGDIVLLPFIESNIEGYYPAWGAFSEFAVVGDKEAMMEEGRGFGSALFLEAYFAQMVIPTTINPISASMIITFREVLSATKRFGFKENNSIIIFGAGPVGLSFTKFAKLLGMGPIIVLDILEEKLKEAKNMGADYVFNSNESDIDKRIKAILKDGADFVLDAVGINQLINKAMELIKYNGKICCYGISPKLNMEIDWSKAPYNWTLQFVQWPSKLEEGEAHRQIINWIELGVLKPEEFISDVIPFGNIIDAYKMVEDRKAKKKIIIKF